MALFEPIMPWEPKPPRPRHMERLIKMAAYPDAPRCPYDGSELEIHFYGPMECLQCGSEFDQGKEGLVPPRETVDEMSKQWPDTLPWSEQEQNYYRTAAMASWRKVSGSYADTLGPESEEQWWTQDRDWGMPKHVFRSMSEKHFQDSLKSGVHQSDERMNWMGQAKLDGREYYPDVADTPEGTVAGRWAYPGYLYNAAYGPNHEYNPNPIGRIVKIEVRPEDGWEPHTEADDEGGYFRTFKPIPTDRFVAWTKPLSGKTFMPVEPSHYPGPHSQYMAAAGDGSTVPSNAGYGDQAGGYSRVWDYPFLYHHPTGQLTWGSPNGYHEPLKDQMRMRGEQVPDDLTHGRWFPETDTVKFYDPKYDRMRPEERQTYDDMIRRNCPHRPAQAPSQTPQEPLSGLPTVEDDWTPAIS